MNNTIGPELTDLVAHFVELQVSSNEDLKQQLTELLQPHDLWIRDTHNTKSIIFAFTVDETRYGLKIEFGEAEVVRDEAHWFELAPADLKTHHVLSHMGDNYAFVLLRWLQNAKTLEEIAIANEGKNTTETIELVIQALEQDRELFESNENVSLLATAEHSYFFDKYHSYNKVAKDFPYLQALLDSDSLQVNGKVLPGPYRFVQAVQQNDELRSYLSPDRAGLIHGDSHADNLLVEDGKIYLLDPKGVDHLPLEYDTGRVHWSLSGWNAIMRGEYELANDDGGHLLTITRRQQYVDGMPRVQEYMGEQNWHRAMYSSAMQYLTRSAHATNESETTALYLHGVEVFDELFEELGEKA